MKLKNCRVCGKMYIENSLGMCDACKKHEEEGFAAIKDYIDEHPHCNIGELSNATGVSIKKILSYIKEGRLMASDGMAGDVTCRSCGVPIKLGEFCEACSVKLNKQITSLYHVEKDEADAKLTGIKMKIKDKL